MKWQICIGKLQTKNARMHKAMTLTALFIFDWTEFEVWLLPVVAFRCFVAPAVVLALVLSLIVLFFCILAIRIMLIAALL